MIDFQYQNAVKRSKFFASTQEKLGYLSRHVAVETHQTAVAARGLTWVPDPHTVKRWDVMMCLGAYIAYVNSNYSIF